MLADRIGQAMMQVGLDVVRHTAGADKPAQSCAESCCRASPPAIHRRGARTSSAAFPAADDVVEDLGESDAEPGDKLAHVRAVARAEFGRKGYEVTTIRDIASAADLGTGTVYRLIGSKDELLASIMQSFGEKAGVDSPACCVPIHPRREARRADLDQHQCVWTNSATSATSSSRGCGSRRPTPRTGWFSRCGSGSSKSLLAEGIKSKTSASTAPHETLARSVIDVGWMPENILRA